MASVAAFRKPWGRPFGLPDYPGFQGAFRFGDFFGVLATVMIIPLYIRRLALMLDRRTSELAAEYEQEKGKGYLGVTP